MDVGRDYVQPFGEVAWWLALQAGQIGHTV